MTRTAKIEKTMDEAEALEQVLGNPPEDWVDPMGNGAPRPEIDRLAWELEIRRGLADKLTGLIRGQKPMVEKLRQSIRLARARGDEMLLRDYTERLSHIEPALRRNEELLKHCTSWVGHGPKALDAKVREAEGAVRAAESLAGDFASGRGLVLGAADSEAKEAIEVALGSTERSMVARVEGARHVVEQARRRRDENAEAISALETKLSALRARRTA